MQMFDVSELISHSKNNEFFDDIIGDNWKEFLESVKTSGVIEPIVITQDKVIVSGHQRVKACKELNIAEVPCRIKIYEDGEKWNKNDLIIKELLETNLRQRGIGNLNPIKFGRCIVELERLYKIKVGNPQLQNNSVIKNQKDLANELGIDATQLQNYKRLLTLIPELQELVEKDQLSATTAYKVWAKLSPVDQQKLFEEIGKDKIIEMTQKETQKYVDEIKIIKQEKQKLKEQLEEKKSKEIDIDRLVADKEDVLKKNDEANKKIKTLEKENEKLKNQEPQIIEIEKEVIPDGVKRELEESRRKIAELQPIKVKYENEELENGSLYLGFRSSVERFLDSNAELVYKERKFNEIPNDLKSKMYEQIIILEKWLNDFKTNVFKEAN
jgi:hypothetical protein